MPAEQEPVRQWCDNLGSEGPAGPGDVHCFETMTARARYGHSDSSFCVVGCRMALWYNAAGIAITLAHECSELKVVTLLRRKVASSHQKYTTKNRRLCPVECCAVCVALVTTTCGSSECRPDDKAEATSRFVARSRSRKASWQNQKNPQLLRRIVAGTRFSPDLVQLNLSRVPRNKRRRGSGTELPTFGTPEPLGGFCFFHTHHQ